jgi:CRP-like cAMP-binding protein
LASRLTANHTAFATSLRKAISSRLSPVFPAGLTWDAATIDELRAYGRERAVSAGDVLLQAGRRSEGFYVVLDGEVEVVRPDSAASGRS